MHFLTPLYIYVHHASMTQSMVAGINPLYDPTDKGILPVLREYFSQDNDYISQLKRSECTGSCMIW